MSLTGLLFAVAFFAALGLALFRRPIYGLYAYVAVFYLDPPSRWWGESLPDLRWALLSAGVTYVAAFRVPAVPGRMSWLRTTPGRFLVAFTVWVWIQNFWALDPEAHLELSILFSKYVLLFYLIYRLVPTPADAMRFLAVHFAGCAYFGYLAFTTASGGRLEGVGGPGVNEANAFAMQMCTGVMVGAVMALTARGVARWAVILCMPFILNGVILSQSRDGFLALLVAGLVLWWLKHPATTKRFYVYAALAVVLFGMLAGDQMFWRRMETIEAAARGGEASLDTSSMSRLALAEAQLKMTERYPLGTGHRGTAVLSPMYLREEFLTKSDDGHGRRASHNTFMTALSEQGVPGAVLFLWVWLWTARATVRLKRAKGLWEQVEPRSTLAAVASALMVVAVAGMFVDYIKAEIQVWLWALLAAMLACQPHESSPSPPRAVVG